MLPTSKSGASSNSEYRCTTAPGEVVGQFPYERSELGKQGYVSGFPFLRKRTPKLRSRRCSLLPHCNHIKQFTDEMHIQIKGRSSLKTDR